MGARARTELKVQGRRARVDATVVETNVHYPTDSTLLVDGIRVLTRTVQRLAAVTGGDLRIEDAAVEHLRAIRHSFRRLGVEIEVDGSSVRVPPDQELVIVDDIHDQVPKIDDGPWPMFPADLTSVAVAIATQARGTVLIFEKMFENRLVFTDKLVSMGARIILCDPHRAVVNGPSRLYGYRMESPDIRAGMAMLLAGLCAEGSSTIGAVYQIDKGYERLDQRLRELGAPIERADGWGRRAGDTLSDRRFPPTRSCLGPW